jgi:hypothetical protein
MSAQVSTSFKARDKMLQRWHPPSLLIIFFFKGAALSILDIYPENC